MGNLVNSYNDLTIQHKIALKEIITTEKARNDLGVGGETSNEYFKSLHALVILGNSWRNVINYYFSEDVNDLQLTPKF